MADQDKDTKKEDKAPEKAPKKEEEAPAPAKKEEPKAAKKEEPKAAPKEPAGDKKEEPKADKKEAKKKKDEPKEPEKAPAKDEVNEKKPKAPEREAVPHRPAQICRGICPKCDNEDDLSNCCHCNYVICIKCITSHVERSVKSADNLGMKEEKFEAYIEKAMKAKDMIEEIITFDEHKLDEMVHSVQEEAEKLKEQMRQIQEECDFNTLIEDLHARKEEVASVRELLDKVLAMEPLDTAESAQFTHYLRGMESAERVFDKLDSGIKYPSLYVSMPNSSLMKNKIGRVETLQGYYLLQKRFDNLHGGGGEDSTMSTPRGGFGEPVSKGGYGEPRSLYGDPTSRGIYSDHSHSKIGYSDLSLRGAFD